MVTFDIISINTLRIISNMCGIRYLLLGFLILPGPSCSNSDNLALLLDTLKLIQHAVCNDDMVSLACPRGTTISIRVAQYGSASAVKDCPGSSVAVQTETEKNCKRPNALQYSLLQTVVEACQKKPQCRFSTVPMEGMVDPCPSQNKYVEVAYKCRPYEFRSRTGCEGEVIKLSCNPHSRIAIFDAQYGRTAYESITCFPAQGVPDETCTATLAVKTVIHLCLGKRRCQIAATNRTFNSSCGPQSRPYLKVIYACVPVGVLWEKYESAAEKDELSSTINQEDDFFDDSEESGEKWGEPNADHALQPPQLQEYTIAPTRTENEETTYINQNIGKSETKEGTTYDNAMLFIYISIGLIVFLILTATLVGVRCYVSKKSKKSKNGDMYTTETPNVFNDAFSDIDNDADVSHISGTFYDPVHPDMILYKNVPGSQGTIRAMKPLCTIYPSTIETNMYGIDYVPTQTSNIPNRFTRSRSNEEESDSNVMTSPRSLGPHATSQYYYG